jgi:transposase
MRHKTGIDRTQTTLFPEVVDDFVSENNPVRFIDAFVDSLDMVDLGFRYAAPGSIGQKPYNPADVLKLYIYGYLNRLRSSRRLEKATHQNVEVMWLLRRLQPDFKTIADFRKDNKKAIKKVYREFIVLCKKLALFGGELIAIDGSKFSAVNHNDKAYTAKKLKKINEQINQAIEQYLHELDAQDDEEKGIASPSAEELAAHIEKLKERQAQLQEKQDKLDETGASQIVTTDSDGRLMSGPHGSDVLYNVQIATDSKNKLIPDFEVTNAVNDQLQLSGMAIKAKETLGVDELDATADVGYYNTSEIKKCDDHSIHCYIPKPNRTRRQSGLYSKDDFVYDPKRDRYTCPAGEPLEFSGVGKRRGDEVKYYKTRACKGCSRRSQCTSSPTMNRRIVRHVDEDVVDQMHLRMRQAPEIAKQRKALVEHPFGTIKHWWDQGYFLTRGLDSVATEMSLTVLCYNMHRAISILGVKELILAVK